jgi:hypothetical protein
MQLDVTILTPEAHRAIVECLIIAARRGRLLREAREREQAALGADSIQNSALEGTDQQASAEDQALQADSGQSIQSDPRLNGTVTDLATTRTKARST